MVYMKPPDLIWDALEVHFGAVRTKSERGRRNRACRELREANVTPEELEVVVAFCQRSFTSFSEMAVCNWLSRALHEDADRSNVRDIFEKMRQTP